MPYAMGQWKAECDRCGRIRLSGKMRQEWNGLRVCAECWEPRHPQEMVRGRPDHQSPPWVRPRKPAGGDNETTQDDL